MWQNRFPTKQTIFKYKYLNTIKLKNAIQKLSILSLSNCSIFLVAYQSIYIVALTC